MKKTLSMVSGLLLALSVFGVEEGLKQLTLAISTPGPDTYADGTPVLVGESYLLVYANQGATFQGLYMDGTLVDPLGGVRDLEMRVLRHAGDAFVEDPLRVRLRDRLARLREDARELFERERAASRHAVGERLAFEELHDHERHAVVGLAMIEHAHRMRRVDLGGRLRFDLETPA